MFTIVLAAHAATPLERLGEQIYIRENCGACHVSPGEKGAEPRVGPDLTTVGGKFPDAWHVAHLQDPLSTTPGSTMPAAPHLLEQRFELATLSPAHQAKAEEQARAMAETSDMEFLGVPWDREVLAVVAFLQATPPPRAPRVKAEKREKVKWKSAEVQAAGEAIYAMNCRSCHGADLKGGIGANLVDDTWLNGGSLEAITTSISEGIAVKGMPAWGPILGEEKVQQVAAFVYAKGR